MEPFFVSMAVAALAEIGDKTQLLALLLAARFKQPYTIITGILLATLANHSLAGTFGTLIPTALHASATGWLLGSLLLALALWAVLRDAGRPGEVKAATTKAGLFGATVIGFFLAEMGDKTQLVTAALAARYSSPVWVVIGSTLGVLLMDVPAVILGCRAEGRLPVKLAWTARAVIVALLDRCNLHRRARASVLPLFHVTKCNRQGTAVRPDTAQDVPPVVQGQETTGVSTWLRHSTSPDACGHWPSSPRQQVPGHRSRASRR
jgi:putative Ca2+/H+ antiporter (TMEM165/GDT1 family)